MLNNFVKGASVTVPIRMYDSTGAIVASATANSVSLLKPAAPTTVVSVTGHTWGVIDSTSAFTSSGTHYLTIPNTYIDQEGNYTVAVKQTTGPVFGVASFTVREKSELDITTLLGALNAAAGTGSITAVLAQMMGKAAFNTSDSTNTLLAIRNFLGVSGDTSASSTLAGRLAAVLGIATFASAPTSGAHLPGVWGRLGSSATPVDIGAIKTKTDLIGAIADAAGTATLMGILAQIFGLANFNTVPTHTLHSVGVENASHPTLTEIEASTVLAKEASVTARPTNPLLADDARLPATLIASQADVQGIEAGGATLAEIEGSTVLAKEATVDALPTLAEIEASTVLAKEASLTDIKGAGFVSAVDSLTSATGRDSTLSSSVGTVIDGVSKILGLLFLNSVQDNQVYDGGKLTSARIRVFDTQANANAVSAGTGTSTVGVDGLTAIYTVTAEYDGDNNLTLFKITG